MESYAFMNSIITICAAMARCSQIDSSQIDQALSDGGRPSSIAWKHILRKLAILQRHFSASVRRLCCRQGTSGSNSPFLLNSMNNSRDESSESVLRISDDYSSGYSICSISSVVVTQAKNFSRILMVALWSS